MASEAELCSEELSTAVAKNITPRCSSSRRSPCWSYLLAPGELLHLKLYLEAWRLRTGRSAEDDPNAFFNLGDNPENRYSWSMPARGETTGRMPGFRKSAGRYWHAQSRRWVTDNERLACLGLPVYASMAAAAQCPLLQIEGSKQMAGNAWQECNAALVAMVAWACVRTKPQTWG